VPRVSCDTAAKAPQSHSEACRQRIEEKIKDIERYKTAKKREMEFIEKAIEAEDKKRKIEEKPEHSDPVSDQCKRKRDPDDQGDQYYHREEGVSYGWASSSTGDGTMVQALEISTNDDIDEFASDFMEAWDDVKNSYLDPKLVIEARMEEISFMRSEGVYEKVHLDECYRVKGSGPTSVRWIDTNKGTYDCPNVRCRLVARDLKNKGDDHFVW
jgi:hypothetical protein